MPRVIVTIAKPKPSGKKPAPMINTRSLFGDLRRMLEPNLKATFGEDTELELNLGDVGGIKVQGLLAKDARKTAEKLLTNMMADFDLGEYLLEISA